LLSASQIVSSSGNPEDRTNTPDRAADFGREKETLHRVAETELVGGTARQDALLIDDGQDRA
jgi:hypothetical protein